MAQGELLHETGNVRLRRCRHGLMLYHTTDKYIGRSFDLYGEFSEGEVDLFRQIVPEGAVALDIGANIGAHTLVMAQHVGPKGHIFAMEAQRVVYQMLCANIAINGLENVHAVWAGAGASNGRITVPRPDYSKEGNFGGLTLDPEKYRETVPMRTVDSFNLNRCDFIKIDVEGMEAEVLEGARNTLAAHRPVLYVENDRKEKSPALMALLRELGYRLYWHAPPLYNPNNFFGNPENVFGGIRSLNLLCAPLEKRQDVSLREVGADEKWYF